MNSISSDLGHRIADYFKGREDVVAVYLFGSFAKGTQRPGSDLDIAVLLDDRPEKIDRYSLISQYLVDLGKLLRQDIHIIFLNDASTVVRNQVFTKGLCVFVANSHKLALFRMLSLAQFVEFAPYLDNMQKSLKEKLLRVK